MGFMISSSTFYLCGFDSFHLGGFRRMFQEGVTCGKHGGEFELELCKDY